jgi:dephospho-CoA kinase
MFLLPRARRSPMRIMGATGLNGSGKDELTNYLRQRCGIRKLSIGDMVRDIAEEENIPKTRENLHDITNRYLTQCGRDYFAKRLIERIEERQWTLVGIPGVRTPTDVLILREHFRKDFLLIHVKVNNPFVRYKRIRRRGKARDPETYEEFLRQDREEEEMFNISDAVKYADITINNDGTMGDFYKEIERSIVNQKLAEYCQGRIEERVETDE